MNAETNRYPMRGGGDRLTHHEGIVKEFGIDCYILDREGKCSGPFSAARAREILEVSPFGLLLLRAGCSPIWSEDLEGVALTLSQAPFLGSVPPDAKIVKFERDLFDGSLAFNAAATSHYIEHKAWFETNRSAGRGKILPVVDSSIDLTSHVPTKVRRARKSFSKIVIGSISLMIGVAFLAVWFRSDIGLLLPGNLATRRFPVSLSPYDRADFSTALGSQTNDPAFKQNSLRDSGETSASSLAARSIAVSVRERSPEAMRQLSRVVSAKLGNEPGEYAERMLGLIPYYRYFQQDFLPPPDLVGAQAFAFLEPTRRESHPAWQPIAGLLNAEGSHALTDLAKASRRLEEHVARMGGWTLSATYITDMLWAGSRTGFVADSAGGFSSEVAYWGRPSGLAADSVAGREGAHDLIELLTQLGALANGAMPRSELASYLLARSLAMANLWGAGSGDPQLGRNISALSEGALRQVNEVDAKILELLGSESIQEFSSASLQGRIATRIGFIRALHQESGFLCAPDRSVYGQEFLLQTVRMAGMLAVPLPALHPIYNSCFFKPYSESSESHVAFLEESAALLKYTPSHPAPKSPEWRLFRGRFDQETLSQNPKMNADEKSILREWLSLVAFSSRNITLRERVANALIHQGCAQNGATRGQKATKEHLCLQARWYALEKESVRGRKELLKEIEAAYGLAVASQVFYPWFASLYLEPRLEDDIPSDPKLLARKLDLERYLDAGQPGYATLQWFARQGMQR